MRYLVVGLGNIGRRRRALLGRRCVATVDPYVPEADHRDVAQCDPASFDAAVLAVPSDAKLALVEHLLGLGKFVLVEKPLVIPDRSTLERLEHLAREHGVCWYTSYNYRFEPSVVRLRELYHGGAIGDLYYARMVVANGTVAHVKGTWRDTSLGVIEDLACHLFDLAAWILDERPVFRTWTAQHHETTGPDHAVLGSDDGRLVLDVSYLSWKNQFRIDLVGSRGSLHLDGMRKWGPCELSVRERVFPSGVPRESTFRDEGPDLSWEQDITLFEERAQAKASSGAEDWWVSECLRSCAGGVR
ncbi:MAG TPA: Gfo/Idh/MocA family oxidoreductase [Candidatus Limnocylindria bacterium]|nr:Gfo/Idh/MocA family oxidoreductase [Candidatus Limnocylindria bacterium]